MTEPGGTDGVQEELGERVGGKTRELQAVHEHHHGYCDLGCYVGHFEARGKERAWTRGAHEGHLNDCCLSISCWLFSTPLWTEVREGANDASEKH